MVPLPIHIVCWREGLSFGTDITSSFRNIVLMKRALIDHKVRLEASPWFENTNSFLPARYDKFPSTLHKKDFFWVLGLTPSNSWETWSKLRWVRPIPLTGVQVSRDTVSWKTSVSHCWAVFLWKHILFHYPRRIRRKHRRLSKFIIPNMFSFL